MLPLSPSLPPKLSRHSFRRSPLTPLRKSEYCVSSTFDPQHDLSLADLRSHPIVQKPRRVDVGINVATQTLFMPSDPSGLALSAAHHLQLLAFRIRDTQPTSFKTHLRVVLTLQQHWLKGIPSHQVWLKMGIPSHQVWLKMGIPSHQVWLKLGIPSHQVWLKLGIPSHQSSLAKVGVLLVYSKTSLFTGLNDR